MKKIFIIAILLSNAFFSSSQTLEYQYPGSSGKIYQVSVDEFLYGIMVDSLKQFNVYSLDHTLIKTFNFVPDSGYFFTVLNLSKTLFNSDSYLELAYDFEALGGSSGFKIINENGAEVFSKAKGWAIGFYNTPQGAKMLLSDYSGYWQNSLLIEVYSLYGTVLGSNEIGSNSENLLFPNPGSDDMQINFSTPENEKNLTLSIFSMKGQLLKNMSIPQNEKSIKFNVSEFTPGAYLYRIHNETFSTSTKSFIVN